VLRFSCIVVAAIAGSTTLAVSAPPIPPTPPEDISCTLHHAVRDINSLSALPGPLRDYVRNQIGPMADRGEFFNATDEILDAKTPGRRFIRAAYSGDTWFLGLELGGIAYSKAIFVLQADPALPGQFKLIAQATYRGQLCEALDGMLQSSWSPIPKPIH
jgi:hypothetical protein